jgi:hypothetical protein
VVGVRGAIGRAKEFVRIEQCSSELEGACLVDETDVLEPFLASLDIGRDIFFRIESFPLLTFYGESLR